MVGYARAYLNSRQRAKELPFFLHRYNWHRPHASIGARPLISRLLAHHRRDHEAFFAYPWGLAMRCAGSGPAIVVLPGASPDVMKLDAAYCPSNARLGCQCVPSLTVGMVLLSPDGVAATAPVEGMTVVPTAPYSA